MNNNFNWIDLSTFDVNKAKRFYQTVFKWTYAEDNSGYQTCFLAESSCAGLYEMPEFFKTIKMPSFWMTYIAVDDIQEIVSKARSLGGKIELEEQGAWGKFALTRDPAGAGFTCYEGGVLQTKRDANLQGKWCWSELVVSDISLVKPFYSKLFGWEIHNISNNYYSISNYRGEKIASIVVESNAVKGDKEFWAVFFVATNVVGVKIAIEQAGGNIAYESDKAETTRLMAYDNQGAAFFLSMTKNNSELKSTNASQSSNINHPVSQLKWRSLIGLMLIFLIIITEQHWAWSLLFLNWIIPDLKSGSTYFFEKLDKHSNPMIYWVVMGAWLSLILYTLTYIHCLNLKSCCFMLG